MAFFRSPPRQASTTIPCKQCGANLTAKRTCHEAFLYCEQCKTSAPIGTYSDKIDDALEAFLEALNCDRA